MKRKVLITAVLLFFTSYLSIGQTAPLGKDLVKSFSEKIQSFQTIKADFTFTLENMQEGFSDTHKGSLNFKGKKYLLNLMGMEVYFNGETKWQFIPEANEVTISKPSSLEGGFFDDPTTIFSNYEQDFNSRFIGEQVDKGVGIYEVDLYPKDISVSYSIIKIKFNKRTLDPISIKYQGKEGINYIIDVTKFAADQPIKDEVFTFDVTKHLGIEVVDLR
jgi:outer membrane lipoprotein-sorting protein